MAETKVWPGRGSPLGATPDPEGVNFAVYSSGAERVELCLFDPENPSRQTRCIELSEREQHVWHAFVPGLKAGALYGYRADGPYEPAAGQRFNPAKLLVDPYARALHGEVDFKAPIFAYPLGGPDGDLARDERDSAPGAPKSVVIDDAFDWGDDAPPRHAWRKSVIYEVHVRGFTMRHPEVPPELRGTYRGFAHPAAIAHLKKLGITAVELLPVHEYVDDAYLTDKGLRNYWGYNTLGYFAPEQRYASGSRGEQVREFKELVKALHAEGIEVILDVVYNHTAEGNQLGPTLCFRGLDNATYYRLSPEDPRFYWDATGCGNSLNVPHPQTLKLVMDSLRYWVEVMHVDGFRFDLATVLARDPFDYNPRGNFLQACHQDPTLNRVKLIAEPWDVGHGGYQVGNLPVQWSEWNGKYRDVVRKFWKGDMGTIQELGYRLTGSADLYAAAGRKIYASVNFVTCHDGFTLRDLVTYNHKHNEANGERNQDGADDNASWNCGVEGETDDPAIQDLRDRQQRNLIATLFVSQGVPMLCAGDELGKTQRGNNNAYCQDNELSWIDWELDDRRAALLGFTRRMIRLRQTHPVLQRRRFFRGLTLTDSSLKDLAWFGPDGQEMRDDDWQGYNRSLAFLLGGDAIATPDERGERIRGDTLLVLLNAHHEAVRYTLPEIEWGDEWELLVDTAGHSDAKRDHIAARGQVLVEARSLVVLSRPATAADER